MYGSLNYLYWEDQTWCKYMAIVNDLPEKNMAFFGLVVIEKQPLPSPSLTYRVLKGGCPRGGGNWGTLRIPRENWGTLRKIRGITTPPGQNPIINGTLKEGGGWNQPFPMYVVLPTLGSSSSYAIGLRPPKTERRNRKRPKSFPVSIRWQLSPLLLHPSLLKDKKKVRYLKRLKILVKNWGWYAVEVGISTHSFFHGVTTKNIPRCDGWISEPSTVGFGTIIQFS